MASPKSRPPIGAPPPLTTPKSNRSAFRLSLGSRYYSEDYFIDALRHIGLTRRGFRAWCRALGVPIIFIGRGAYINARKFEIALEAVSHIGQPDFAAPGARKPPRRAVTRLDPEFVRRNYDTFVGELLIGYIKPNGRKPQAIIDDAYRIARDWACYDIAHRPRDAQDAISRRARRVWQTHADFTAERHPVAPTDPDPSADPGPEPD